MVRNPALCGNSDTDWSGVIWDVKGIRELEKDSDVVVIFQVMGTAAIVLVALLLLFGGLTFGGMENVGESFGSLDGFIYVFLMIPSMLVGFDVLHP